MPFISKIIAAEHFTDLSSTFIGFCFKAVQANACILDITEPPTEIPDYPQHEIGDLMFMLRAHTEKLKYGRYVFTEICTEILKDISDVDIDSLLKESDRI